MFLKVNFNLFLMSLSISEGVISNPKPKMSVDLISVLNTTRSAIVKLKKNCKVTLLTIFYLGRGGQYFQIWYNSVHFVLLDHIFRPALRFSVMNVP